MILDVETRTVDPEITVIALIGRMTLGNRLAEIEHLLRATVEKGCRKLVVDLSQLDFLDSAGIGVLVVCAGALRQAGGEMRIAGANERVQKTLDVALIGTLIPLSANVDAACRSFSSGASA